MNKMKDAPLLLVEGDIFICSIDNKPSFFGRVNEISFDDKPGWYEFFFSKLGMPLENIVWKIQSDHINGGEFSMGGKPFLMQKVLFPPPRFMEGQPVQRKKKGNVIDLTDVFAQRRETYEKAKIVTEEADE